MRGLLFIATILSVSASADTLSGKTADGCSYKIINGQYLTSCPSKGTVEPAAPVAHDTITTNTARPVGSYGDVPVRRNNYASAPSLPPQQPVAAPRASAASAYEPVATSEYALDERDDERRERLRTKLLDKTYAGILLGASNMKETNTGSSIGLGLSLGTNIDDHFGVELGYTYAKQSLRMGLASRGANVDQGSPVSRADSDAALSAHLFTGEFQAHLTDPLKRLRPYLGGGFGWRSATLSENQQNASDGLAAPSGGGSLHQSSFGGLASAGTKLRLSKTLQLGFAFRYFFPIARQDSRVEQGQNLSSNNPDQAPSETKITKADDILTGSSQYQVLGGLQYSF